MSTLSQMMLLMMQSNPSLVQSSDRYSNGDLSGRLEGLKLDTPPSQFTYIPPDPLETYCELLSRCLDWDLEVLKTLPEDEDVSLGVLSLDHVALLSECAVRWRLAPSFRAWIFLEAIVERCEQGLVPTACVHEATAMVQKVQAEMPSSTWTVSDVSLLWYGLADHSARRCRTNHHSKKPLLAKRRQHSSGVWRRRLSLP